MTEKKEAKKLSITSLTVDEARRSGQFFEDGDRVYVRFRSGDHHEVWPLHSVQARTWLASIAHQETGNWVTASTLKVIADLLDGLVRVGGLRMPVYIRVARKDGAVYLDLGTDDWTCVKVSAEGWRIVPHPGDGPYFYRPKRLQPLPNPIDNAPPVALDGLLKPFINVTDDDMRLVVAAMIDALKGRGPYVVLTFIGPAGSTKSSASKAYISTFDPSRSRSRVEGDDTAPTTLKPKPRSDRDFPPMIGHSHALGIDNLSYIEDWLSDMLCVVATGGDVSERALYQNFEEATLAVCNPVVLNGIESFVTRGDLTDRTIRLDVVPITEEERLEEVELWRRFEKDHPLILGALLDTLSAAMAEHPQVQLKQKPRMADFARWGVAVERALGWPEGSFLETYRANQEAAVAEMLSGDLVANLILRFMDGKPSWHGTPTELLTALTETAAVAMIDTRDQSFPKTPRGVTGKLQRIGAALAKFGIEIRRGEVDRHRITPISITNRGVAQESVTASTSAAMMF